MAWEVRGNGKYYYGKRWANGTCHSQYVGRGEPGEMAATIDTLEREKTTIDRLTWQAEKAKVAEVDRQIDDLCKTIRTITAAVLLATGHYQHKGTWRKTGDKKRTDK